MAFESYNAQDIWSSGESPGSSSNLLAAGKLALAAGAAGIGFNRLMAPRQDGTRPLDTLASFARTGGNLSPFQLANTFRVPEFLFPFTSPSYQGLTNGEYIFQADFLKNRETSQYIQKVTGKTQKELHALGLTQEAMLGPNAAEGLVYRANKTGARGTLHVRRGGAETLLSDSVMLMSRDSEIDPLTREVKSTNKAFKGILQALDMWEHGSFDEDRVLASGQNKAGVAFVPSVSGPTKTLGDLYRRSTFFRGISAFEVSRFNELAGEYSRQIFGETGAKFTQTVFGIGNQVTPGPASALLGRYAGRAAMLGAGALAVSQSDWIRREYGLPGQAFSAGLTTAGGAYAAWKMGAPNKLVMMGAVASFFGQMTLPGFDRGILEGLGSTAAGLDVMRGSALNPFGYYRRTLEGFAPGISDWKTGAFLGIGAMMASSMRLPGTGKRISEHIVEKLGSKRLGLSSGIHGIAPDELLNTRDLFWKKLDTDLDPLARGGERWRTTTGRRDIYSALKEKLGGHEATSRLMNTEWRTAENTHREMMQNSRTRGVGKDLLTDLQRISLKYENSNTFTRSTLMQAEGFASQVFHSFFGADANYDKLMRDQISHLGFSGVTPVGRLGRLATVGLAAMGLQQIFTGGLFGSMESSEDLREIYAGRKMIEVKKARGWEGGSQPFGGGETSYFRPHALSLMVNRTREAGIWGENEDDISPIKKFLIKNFTYDLERQNYYDRPYPITGGFGEDIPILGGLISSTIGRLIKPPKLMHVEEWAREGAGGTEFRSIYQGSRQEPAYALGAQGPGTPVSPYSIGEQAIAMSDQVRQISGFPGFARNTIQKIITGSQNFRHNQPILATAGHMDSPTRAFWEADLGGGFFCFPGDALVQTKDGQKAIVDVQVGEEVLSTSGVYRRVQGKIQKPNSDHLLRITTKSLVTSIECTPNHHIPVLRRSRYAKGHVKPFEESNFDLLELEAKDILPGDFLYKVIDRTERDFIIDLKDTGTHFTQEWVYSTASPPYAEAYEMLEKDSSISRKQLREAGIPDLIAKEVLSGFREGSKPLRVKRYIPVDDGMAEAVGWFIAEGYAGSGALFYTMHKDELSHAESILKTFNNLGFYGRIETTNNTLHLYICSSNLARYFKLFGDNAHHKYIPLAFKQLPNHKLEILINSLLLGDGWTKGFTSVSKQLVLDLSDCLLKLGRTCFSTLGYLEKGKGLYPQGTPRKDCLRHYLTLNGRGCDWRFFQGYYLLEVGSIMEVPSVDLVYDLSIEGEHYYTVSGILVHNTTELWRRLFPKGPDKVNPIRNNMPSWMPDKFHTGDPYANIDWGEARLPGAGYASLHKELRGVDPEEYPLLARMAILSDVAPASVEYRRIAEQVYAGRQQGQYSEAQNNYIDTLDQQAAAKLNQYTFKEQHDRAINLPGSGVTRSVWHSGLSALRHVAAPAEYMVPMGFRPTQKLLADYRDPIEAYEQERLYGTQVAFWDKPMRDWFRPAAYSAAHMLGFDGKPMWRREADAVDQKFDELEFHKWMTLALQAEAAGDKKGKNQYMWAASNTRTGINPQGSAMGMYWALPESERSFFNAFSMAQGSERERVLEMVPGDQAHLYKSIWSRMDSGDPTVHSSEGLGVDENYLKAKYYQQQTTDMPSEDWIGWHSEVDMSDIKVKYAEKYAQDIADYGVWESQVKKAEGQEFLEGSEGYIGPPGTIAAEQIRSRLWNMSGNTRNRPSVSVFPSTSGTRAHMIYNDHRDGEIVSGIQKAIFGGY